MSRRFIYDRSTSDQMATMLRDIDMAPETFSRISGIPLERVARWLSGAEVIPIWVPVVLQVLSVPGAKDEALAAAEAMIRGTESAEVGEKVGKLD